MGWPASIRLIPLFVLSCCLISKRDYMDTVVPAIQRIKFATFGHDSTVLHEREIRRDLGPFSVLRDRERKHAFLAGLEMPFDPVICDKKSNSIGLQLADLVARPIGMSRLRPEQPNRAWAVIQEKLDKDPHGRHLGYGLKCFP